MSLLFVALSDPWSVCQRERSDRAKGESLMFTVGGSSSFGFAPMGAVPLAEGSEAMRGDFCCQSVAGSPTEWQVPMHDLVSPTLKDVAIAAGQFISPGWTELNKYLLSTCYMPGVGLGTGYCDKQ